MTLFGNASALDSALENIVRNALRYSHTRIAVAFSADNQGVTIQVDDDGPGVSAEDREQIFRPFYRTDEARDRESGGTGLGGDRRSGGQPASRLGEGRRQPAWRPEVGAVATAASSTFVD